MNEGMAAYTKWWIAHPWHVTGTPESGKVPDNCDCEGCEEKRTDKQRASAQEGGE